MSISLLLVAASIWNVILAVAVSRKTRHQRSRHLFALYLFWVAGWTMCTAIVVCPYTFQPTALLFCRATFACATCFSCCAIWFCALFPYPSRISAGIAFILTLCGLPCLAWSLTSAFIRNLPGPVWGDQVVFGPYFSLFALWIIVTTVAAILCLAQKLIYTRGLERMQVAYILTGMVGMYIGGAICNLLIPYLTDGATTYAAYGPLCSLILTTAASYAILRHRLMDISVILRSLLTYILTICTLTLLFMELLFSLQRAVIVYFHIRSNYASIIIAPLVAALFHPVFLGMRFLVDRFILKTADYRKTLRETSQAFASVRAIPPIIKILTNGITQMLQPTQTAIFMPESDGAMQRAEDSAAWASLPDAFSASDPVIRHAARHDNIILATELVDDAATREIGLRLQSWGAELMLPLVAGTQLCGLVLLSEKSAGGVYSSDDIGLLRILSKQAAMALENAHHYEALRRANMQLEERVRERTQQLAVANTQLAQTNRALEAADKAKDEFLAVLSHELKTPLTCILAWAEVAHYDSDPAIVEKSLGVITHNALRQRHLLNDLLDVSRIIHHKLLLHPEPLDLWQLAVQCVDELTQVSQQREVMFTLAPPAEAVPVWADPERMAQVVTNLLNNALKFTEPGGRITITGGKQGDAAILRVIDTGRGIPADALPKLFMPFRQVERIEQNGGLGLGLALVKGITELHGGQVTAESFGEGQGSTFTVSLPLWQDARQLVGVSAAAVDPESALIPS